MILFALSFIISYCLFLIFDLLYTYYFKKGGELRLARHIGDFHYYIERKSVLNGWVKLYQYFPVHREVEMKEFRVHCYAVIKFLKQGFSRVPKGKRVVAYITRKGVIIPKLADSNS